MAGEKILVIDSNAEQVKNPAERALAAHGFAPLLVQSQEKALQAIRAHLPSLLLLHLQPDSALNLLARLVQTGLSVPSILVMDNEAGYLPLELVRLGVRDCIGGLFTEDQLLAAVHRALGYTVSCSDDGRLIEELSALNGDLEHHLKEFGILLGTGRPANSLIDLDAVLHHVTEAAVLATGAEQGYLLLVEEKTGELRLRAAHTSTDPGSAGIPLQIDHSVSDAVVRSGKPMLLSGDETPGVQDTAESQVKSLLNVPLKVDGRVIGVLGVNNCMVNTRLTLAHMRRLSTLAELIAAAVENARKYAELHKEFTRRVREIAVLQAMADQLSVVSDFHVGARLALSLALKTTDAEAGLLAWAVGEDGVPAFHVSEGNLCTPIPAQGSDDPMESWWDQRTLQTVIRDGQPVLVGNARSQGNGYGGRGRSRLVVPMRQGARVVGAIHLESSLSNAFSQEDLRFVLSLSDQVAVAMEGKVQQASAETERERLSLLMEAVDNAVWAIDADLRLLAQNEAAAELLGWPQDEALGRSLYDFAPTNHASAGGVCQLLSRVMEERQRVSFPSGGYDGGERVLLQAKGGRTVSIQGRAVPLVRNGRVVGAICAFREFLPPGNDERVRFEFANMASHLLRTPLSFIQASVDLMLATELSPAEQLATLNKMREQSQRMREFIKDLLEISRLETDAVPVNPEPVILPPLISRVLNLIRPDEPRFAFRFVPPRNFPVVAADPVKIELILLGLLRGAMNRARKGGSISIELEAHSAEVFISIVDDGEPIPVKQIDRVFSQFYPVDDAENKMPSTYQLGLYATKRLIELQNGRVWAESQPDTGTRLGFSLPIWGVSR